MVKNTLLRKDDYQTYMQEFFFRHRFQTNSGGDQALFHPVSWASAIGETEHSSLAKIEVEKAKNNTPSRAFLLLANCEHV